MNSLKQILLHTPKSTEVTHEHPLQNQPQQMNEIIIEERNTAIDHLATDMQQVSELFSDMALLVNEQGENIDNIQINIENSDTNIQKATDQIIKANKYQNKKRRRTCKCICCLITAITISGIILIIKTSIQ